MGGFFGAAVCAAAKFMGGSPFDHIGVVVRKTRQDKRATGGLASGSDHMAGEKGRGKKGGGAARGGRLGETM